DDALAGAAARMASEDLEWVVMAIRIQRDVGGNLAEVLRRVAATLRLREKQRRQVKALSAEGRLSGVILCALPVGLLVLLSVVNPTYMATLTGTLLGWMLLGTAGTMLAVGALWISKVVKVDC
ncbi:MAG: type II secretion system F family protein, partial [Actinomycetes bacterium]